MKLSYVDDNVDVPIYRNPEWQADVFASEFLMPFDGCINLNPDEIRKKYHVSKSAAHTRCDVVARELNK